MITIKAELTMKTIAGFDSRVEGDKTIFGDYRDISHVEEVIDYVYKIFAYKNKRDAMVTFVYDDGTTYGYSIARITTGITFGKLTEMLWKRNSSTPYSTEDFNKLTKKRIKDLYLYVADMANDIEENGVEVAE